MIYFVYLYSKKYQFFIIFFGLFCCCRYDETNNKDMITWICSNIVPYASQTGGPLSVQTAQAVFHYPIVGRVIFRQVENEPDSDTTIIVEKLIHADGRSTNNSADHR